MSSSARFDEPLPRHPEEMSAVYEQFKRDVLPYPTGNIHPRFWGWVMGTGTPLEVLAEVAREHGLWLHVDGAFGAFAAISPALRPLVEGLAEADSLAFDLHKWGYLQYEAGCLLVRDSEAHRAAFAAESPYLAPGLDGPELDARNAEILVQLQEQGIAVLSSTSIEGRFALRAAITNHRSRQEDFDALVVAVQRLGAAEGAPRAPVQATEAVTFS